MSIISEVLFDLVMSLDLEVPFGKYAYSILGVITLALAGAGVWVFWISSTPLSSLPWGLILLAGSILAGGIGAFASVIHLQRDSVDKGQAAFCFVSSLLALAVPLARLLR